MSPNSQVSQQRLPRVNHEETKIISNYAGEKSFTKGWCDSAKPYSPEVGICGAGAVQMLNFLWLFYHHCYSLPHFGMGAEGILKTTDSVCLHVLPAPPPAPQSLSL